MRRSALTVENESVVDIISTKPDGVTVVLTIRDHLDWVDTSQHQVLLQNKLNRYLAFVESGELLEAYPTPKGCAVEFRHQPDTAGRVFLINAKQVVESAGFTLHTTVFADSIVNQLT